MKERRDPAGNGGAYRTGIYPDFLAEAGIPHEITERLLREGFEKIFFDSSTRLFFDRDGSESYILDTANGDVRSEGMGYGMMICVQEDRKDLFDRLWRFVRRRMIIPTGQEKGFFSWSADPSGKLNETCPAPDGEEYIAMALFMASSRWGNGMGIMNYAAEARRILLRAVHQLTLSKGSGLFDPHTKLICFVPGSGFTDPSYHLPHFYELFAERTYPWDRRFFREAAAASRDYIVKSAHPVTGLSPEYAGFYGKPVFLPGKDFAYYSDAYRVAMNIALDHLWFGGDERLSAVAGKLQSFFIRQLPPSNFRVYNLDGTARRMKATHPIALASVLAAAGIACEGPHKETYFRLLTELEPDTAETRYYNNLIYYLCLLMLTGNYRIY